MFHKICKAISKNVTLKGIPTSKTSIANNQTSMEQVVKVK